MSEDVTGPKSGWNAGEGSTNNSLSQSDRPKASVSGSHQTGSNSVVDQVTGISRLALSSGSPSVTFASTSRQR